MAKKHKTAADDKVPGESTAPWTPEDAAAFGEKPVPVDDETRKLVGLGAEYDATMTAVANGIEAAQGKKVKAPADPNRPRAVFLVMGVGSVGADDVILSKHKTLRRALKWVDEQGALIRRLFTCTTIYRAKEVK